MLLSSKPLDPNSVLYLVPSPSTEKWVDPSLESQRAPLHSLQLQKVNGINLVLNRLGTVVVPHRNLQSQNAYSMY